MRDESSKIISMKDNSAKNYDLIMKRSILLMQNSSIRHIFQRFDSNWNFNVYQQISANL